MSLRFERVILGLIPPLLSLSLAFIIFFPSSLSAIEIEQSENRLIEKVSKDFTKKFCNGIAFGLSKDSAMKFAVNENFLVFEKKKGINSMNKELLSNKIANSVVDNCGYPLNLKGDQGIKEFEKDYLLIIHDFFDKAN